MSGFDWWSFGAGALATCVIWLAWLVVDSVLDGRRRAVVRVQVAADGRQVTVDVADGRYVAAATAAIAAWDGCWPAKPPAQRVEHRDGWEPGS